MQSSTGSTGSNLTEMGQDLSRSALTSPHSFSKVENSWTASVEYYSTTTVPESSSQALLESSQYPSFLLPLLIGLAILGCLLLMSLLTFCLVIYFKSFKYIDAPRTGRLVYKLDKIVSSFQIR